MTSTSVVDTNVVLRYLPRDDERLYQRASKFFRRVQDDEEIAYSPDSVMMARGKGWKLMTFDRPLQRLVK